MPFGKHKDVDVNDLPVSYLKWLNSNIKLWQPLLSEVEIAIYGQAITPIPVELSAEDKIDLIVSRGWTPRDNDE